MCQITPEKIGIPRVVVFTFPVEDSEPILLALPETIAKTVQVRATAAGIPEDQFLAATITRAASNPRNPWNLLPPS